jgi:hypothetical protein
MTLRKKDTRKIIREVREAENKRTSKPKSRNTANWQENRWKTLELVIEYQ